MIYPYCFCREVSRDREKKRDQEDEEEAYERRKLERKLRDKEAAYREVGNGGRTPKLRRVFDVFGFWWCPTSLTTGLSPFILMGDLNTSKIGYHFHHHLQRKNSHHSDPKPVMLKLV